MFAFSNENASVWTGPYTRLLVHSILLVILCLLALHDADIWTPDLRVISFYRQGVTPHVSPIVGVMSKWSFLPFLCLTQYFINRTTQNIENNRFGERFLRNLLIIVLRQTVFVCSNVAPNTKGLRTNQSVHIGLKFMSLQLSNFRIHVQIYEKSVDKPL